MHIVLPNAFDLAPTLQHGQNRKRNPRITSADHVWSLIHAKTLSERVVDLPVQFSQMGQRLSEPVITQLMTSALADPEMLSLAAGFTDNSWLPKALVGKAAARLTSDTSDPETLQYGTNQGRHSLRKAICCLVSSHAGEDATRFHPEQVFLTQGSQQALYLAMQVLCDPGDIVLVEEPTYFVFMEMLAGLGIEARAIPYSSKTGIDFEKFGDLIDVLQSEGDWNRVSAVYLESYFSNPSSRSLSTEAKVGLAECLQARGCLCLLLRMPPTVTYISKHLGRQSPPYLCLLSQDSLSCISVLLISLSLAVLSLDLASVITRNGLVTCFTPRGIKTLVPATLFKRC